MASTRGKDDVVRVLDRCRAVWAFSDVPDGRAEEMADELELHLRQRLEDGGSLSEVVGSDVDRFARRWAGEESVRPSSAHRLSRWIAPPTLAVAVYLLASSAVELVRHGSLEVSLSSGALGMMTFLVAGAVLISRPKALRWILAEGRTIRAFAAGALTWLMLLALAAATETLARTLGTTETFTVPWPLTTALLALGAGLTLLVHSTRPGNRP